MFIHGGEKNVCVCVCVCIRICVRGCILVERHDNDCGDCYVVTGERTCINGYIHECVCVCVCTCAHAGIYAWT